jgi:hypothetical protein
MYKRLKTYALLSQCPKNGNDIFIEPEIMYTPTEYGEYNPNRHNMATPKPIREGFSDDPTPNVVKSNHKEITKNLLLLEEHCFKQDKCTDCIYKHLLIVDALLEEDSTYSAADKEECRIKIDKIRTRVDAINKLNDKEYSEIARDVRSLMFTSLMN